MKSVLTLKRNDPEAVGKMVARLVASVDILAELPAAGRIGSIAGTREIVLSGVPHIIPYRVRHDIEIITLKHASQEWPKSFQGCVLPGYNYNSSEAVIALAGRSTQS